MTIGTCKWLLAAGLALNLSTAGATIILDAPGTVSVNTVLNDNVVIDNRDASLLVGTGGVVQPVRVYQGTVDVSDNGRVIGNIWLGGGRSTARLSDQATVSGIYSDSSAWWNDESQATVRVYLQDQAMVTGGLTYSGYLRIQDQAIVSGNISNVVTGNIGIDMSGGLVTGMMYVGAGNSMSLNLDGGVLLGGVRGIWGDIDLNVSGGTIAGGIRTGAAVNGEISGGRINDGISLITTSGGSSNLRITGGQFDTALDNWLVQFETDTGTLGGRAGVLEIWGGQFGYAGAGQGFLIDDLMSFSVYGRDLVYSEGWLTGYLQDGSWFSNALTFGSNWQGTFTIHNVPEPETLALFLVGLMGAAVSRRKRRR